MPDTLRPHVAQREPSANTPGNPGSSQATAQPPPKFAALGVAAPESKGSAGRIALEPLRFSALDHSTSTTSRALPVAMAWPAHGGEPPLRRSTAPGDGGKGAAVVAADPTTVVTGTVVADEGPLNVVGVVRLEPSVVGVVEASVELGGGVVA